ncbi:hypothetical protein D3C85_1646190 [compost metagenome]
MAPPAPPLLSTSTGTPSSRLRRSAIKRPELSTEPPGVNGTTRVMGLEGYAAWAFAAASGARVPAAARLTNSRLLKCMCASKKMARYYERRRAPTNDNFISRDDMM